MPDETLKDQGTGQTMGGAGEKVGDILRKERVTRRITVETVAKDLKLNVGYIKALEANDYEHLPADPYIRVYLRSIASYLNLDPEQILRKFFEDRGLKQTTYQEERSTKLTITMKKEQGSRMPWPLILTVVIVLAVLGYVANKKGWISSSSTRTPTEVKTPAGIGDETTDTVGDDEIDSLIQGQPFEESADEEQGKASDETTPGGKPIVGRNDSLRLSISVAKDSVWIQMFADGESWRNFVRPSTGRAFAAADSFNVHVGNNALATFALNGKKIKLKGKGVVYFKLDRNGPKEWDLSKWNRVFKGRLDQ